MKKTNLQEAVYSARRFLDAAKELEDRTLDERGSSFAGCKESGQVRRDSMDLTRALANLRRGPE